MHADEVLTETWSYVVPGADERAAAKADVVADR